jgi:nitrilase
MSKVAIIQEAPIFLDRERTIQKAVSLVEKSAAEGADLIIFPEAFIPGYPAWIWRLKPGGDWGLSEQLYASLLENSVNIERGDLTPLYDAAKSHNVTITCGVNEKGSQPGNMTLYNTAVIIGPQGELINRHRKLMPTNPERMVWGFGDASGLKVVETPGGRVGTLLCWENYMPLARYALYSQGVEIYIAPTYDSGDSWIGTLQHIAREGRCWVIGSGVVLSNSDIPEDFPERDRLYPDSEEWINPGDSCVIAPGGEVSAGPMHQEKGILYAEIDTRRVGIRKRDLDITGHYARPDIFTLHVNSRPQNPLKID